MPVPVKLFLDHTMKLLPVLSCAFLLQLSSLAHALDPLSYARYDQVRTSALHLDLKADFTRKTLSGHADLSLEWLDPAARELVLDTRELKIAKVQVQDAGGQWRTAPHKLDKADEEKGAALRIALKAQPSKVRIHYRSAPSATALQWLSPQQTMSGKKPFMFSQSQSIDARSWVPLQDTPAVRFRYSAKIAAPAGLRVLMSANNDPAATGKGGWKFEMPQPIPSYLLAIAIGELEVRALGPRSAVYAEPARIEAAAHELADTEKMIDAAQALYGPYRWGRYDMVVLPPSFPFGGMENPRITFLTPTMIAGDRSLVSLIAHELAHSWSGNLVTNATWKHFWLNEGFTNYVTTRIIEVLYGRDFAMMDLRLEQEELYAKLKTIDPKNQTLVTLGPDQDPANTYVDDGLAYTKGAFFLLTLEQRVGRAVFDPFLRGWFEQHAFQSVTSDQFVDYLRKNLLAQHPQAMSAAELAVWLHDAGMPANVVRAESPRLTALDTQRAAWVAGQLPTAKLDTVKWSAFEWIHFLTTIAGSASADQMRDLDRAFALAKSANNEVAFHFYIASIKAGYTEVREPLRAFLTTVGRRKFVLPLFTALMEKPADQAWAREVYASARPRYHSVTSSAVDKLMKN